MNFIHSRIFRNTTSSATVASSSNAAFPSPNATLIHKPYQTWRSGAAITVAGSATGNTNRTYIGIDLGSAQAVGAMVVININVISAFLQSSSDGAAWTSVAASPINRDPSDGFYKIYTTQSATARYWRVNAATATTTNGISALCVGTIALFPPIGSGLVPWLGTDGRIYNPGFPYGPTTLWPHIANNTGVGGGRSPVNTGNRGVQIVLSQSNIPFIAKGALDDLNEASPATPIMLYRNYNNTSEVYICYKVGDMSYPLENALMHNLRGVILEACV